MLKIVDENNKDKTETNTVTAKLLAMSFNNGNSVNVFLHPNDAESVFEKYSDHCKSSGDEGSSKSSFINFNYVSIVYNPIEDNEFEVEGKMCFDLNNVISLQIESNDSTAPKIIDP